MSEIDDFERFLAIPPKTIRGFRVEKSPVGNKIVSIPFQIPSKFDETHQKLNSFFPPSMVRSPLIPVIQKRFPKNVIQLWVKPWIENQYTYVVCVKPIGEIDLDYSTIHDNNCLIEFDRDDYGRVGGNLHIQILK